MRNLLVSLVVIVVGLLGQPVLQRYMNHAPELTWRVIALLLVGGGATAAVLSDPVIALWYGPGSTRFGAVLVFALAFGCFGATIGFFLQLERQEPPTSNATTTKLKRLEFLQHRSDAVTRIAFTVVLDRAYSPDELGVFRILLTVLRPPLSTLFISAHGPVTIAGMVILGRPAPAGVQHSAWRANDNLKFESLLQDTMLGGLPTNVIQAWTGSGGDFSTLQSFDGAILAVNVTENLWPKVKAVSVSINDYVMLNQPRSCLAIADAVHAGQPSSQVDWPSNRRPGPDTKWVKIVPAYYKPGGRIPPRLGFSLPFSSYTPLLLSEFSEHQQTVGIPTCDWYGPEKP